MNIYLDIDGVLLANEFHAAKYADEFLQHVINKYPHTTYWLTTHNWRGENRTMEVLGPKLRAETARLLKQVKPTEWGELKTDGIDFGENFLWFDDDLWPDERKVLIEHGSIENMVMIDLKKDPEILRKLIDVI